MEEEIKFKPCAQCGKNFIIVTQKKFCSKECKDEYYNILSNTREYKAEQRRQGRRYRTRLKDRQNYEEYKIKLN